MVLNISEMEAKVREATNDEPWCASFFLSAWRRLVVADVLRGLCVGVQVQR